MNCIEADTDLSGVVVVTKNIKPQNDDSFYDETPDAKEPISEHQEWLEDDLRRRNRERL